MISSRMPRSPVAATLLALALAPAAARADWPAAQSPAIPAASGAVFVKDAAVPPVATRRYKAVVEATLAADQPTAVVPALDMTGSEYNTLAMWNVPLARMKMAVVFHGPAVDGLLKDEGYRAKFGVANPNLPLLAQLKKAGVHVYVCAQHLAASNIDPAALAPEVEVASDALIVLMAYQNDGYALLRY